MSSIKRALAPAALVLALGACASGGGGHGPKPELTAGGFEKDAKTPLDQYAIKVERRPEEVALAVHASGLSQNQRAALAAFADTWRAAGGDAPVVVAAPSGPSGTNPQIMVEAAASALSGYGVPSSLLRYAAYDPGGLPDAPITARFDRYVAQGPDCANQWDNWLSTNANNPTRHFGCARASNLAAMVADPRDLIGPQPMTPSDGLRRATVLDKYRKGEITASARDDQASGAISQAVH